MKYRNLGRSGLRVSCLGLGARGTFGAGISDEEAERVLSAAYESGVTLFDAAEASGRAEKMLGNILRSKGWRRSSYVVTTRVFWGAGSCGVTPSLPPRADEGLSRKHVLEGLRGSLQRLQLDYVDVVFAGPRPGPAHTEGPDPTLRLLRLEELVRAMSDVIDRGLALYWGTAGAPGDVMDAYAVARQFNLVAPVCQWAELPPEPRLFRQIGLGALTWSPVAPGPTLDEEPLPHGRPIARPGPCGPRASAPSWWGPRPRGCCGSSSGPCRSHQEPAPAWAPRHGGHSLFWVHPPAPAWTSMGWSGCLLHHGPPRAAGGCLLHHGPPWAAVDICSSVDLRGLQVDICSTMDLHGLQWISAPAWTSTGCRYPKR
ncbi:voltage-gated potassium channel subunit beta-2-like [Ciconia boyciana]|uniref:voltage-gated potassium channel subunit beta-2-like n=1 Tax=Ciconia boyciana TaxID=52775 RepID=UPI003BA0580B